MTLQLAGALQAFGSLPSFLSSVHIKDGFDILIVATVIYFILIFIKQTRSFFIFNSLIFLGVINFTSQYFDLGLTRQFFQPLLAFFIFIFVIVFQREIRRFFKWFAEGKMIFYGTPPASFENINAIVKAVFEMSKRKIGALIVFPGEYPLSDIVESGTFLNGKISYPLIISIFDSATPGHDGAMLIENNEIQKFGLHLPLAEDFKSTSVGTRHRAAVGLTERTDALVVVVSEERGTVSVTQEGAIRTVHTPEDLEHILKEFMKETEPPKAHSFWKFFFVHNIWIKVISLCFASVLWFIFVFQIGVVQKEVSIPIEFRLLPKEYVIQATNVNTVTVTLSGRYRDLENFDPNSIKLALNLASATSGKSRFPLTKEAFSAVPTYLQITDFTPEEIRIDIVSATSTEN